MMTRTTATTRLGKEIQNPLPPPTRRSMLVKRLPFDAWRRDHNGV